MNQYELEKEAVRKAVEAFPKTFKLRAFPGETFRVNLQNSYISEGRLILYTDILQDGKWVAFAKGSRNVLRNEIVKEVL